MEFRNTALTALTLTMTLFLGIGLLLTGVAEEGQSWRGHGIQFEGNEATQDNPWGITAGIIDTPEDGRCMLLTPGTGVTIGDFRGEELELDIHIHPWVSETSDGAALGVTYLDARGKAVSQGTLSVESDQRLEYVVDMKLHPKAASVRLEQIDWDNHGVDNDWIIIDSPPVESEPEEWRELQVSFVNTEPTSDNPWGFTAGIIDTDVDGQGLLLTSDTGAVLRALKTDSVYRLTINLHPWVAEKSDGVRMKLIYLDAQESVVTEKTVVINKGQKLEYGIDLTRYPTATHLKMLCERREGERVEGDWIMVSMPVPETAPEEWQGLQVSFLNTKATEDNPWGFTAGAIDTDEDGRCLLLTPGTGAMLRELDDESAVRLSMRLHPWVAEKSDGAGLKVAYLDEQDEVVAEDELALEKDQEIQYDVELAQHPTATHVRMLCNSGKKQNSDGDWVVIGVLQITKGETPEAQAEQEDWNGLQTSCLNPARTEDNPWGTTAGIIDTDEDGRCLLLTPNTGAVLKIPEEMREIRLGMRIHPWVAEHSDGAGVLVWLLDAGDNILHEENIPVGNTADYVQYQQDLTAFQGVTHVALRCNNGANGDDSGDWVVVRLE